MSLIQVGIDSGFVELGEGKGILIIHPKRVINPAILQQLLQEMTKKGYESKDKIAFNQPIVMVKKEKLDLTELATKLFALSGRYGIYLKVETFVEENDIRNGEIGIGFEYKGKSIEKRFDVDMLCSMERDYLTGWLEESLQKIDSEVEAEKFDVDGKHDI